LSAGVIRHIYKTLEDLNRRAGKYGAVRLQLDFGSAVKNGSMEQILNLEKWTHSWDFLSYANMSVFDMSILKQREAEELVRIHERATLSSKEGTSVFFRNNPHLSIKVVSERNMEEWIKKSLEVLVLSLLQQRPMCGIDIIKTISRSFGVKVNQGVVYPILYSLKDNGYVEKIIETDNKTRVYVPTESGRRFMNKKLRGYLLAQSSLLSFINDTNPSKGVERLSRQSAKEK
jgi:DNA-binding PadR family transcriptional regulator